MLRAHFFKQFGYNFMFPDTSNTRFLSHLEAAGHLLKHRKFFIDWLDNTMRWSKTTHTLNNVEANVLRGLQCLLTCTDLSIYALYCQSISKPYMRQVCYFVNSHVLGSDYVLGTRTRQNICQYHRLWTTACRRYCPLSTDHRQSRHPHCARCEL